MKKLFTTLLLTSASLMGYAQVWIDVTDKYVTNPRFDNNDYKTGWLGDQFSANNPKGNAEHYNKNYDTYQNLTGLTPGKYRVSVNAFYRMGDANNDYSTWKSGNYRSSMKAKLYVTTTSGTKTVAITPASEEKYDQQPATGSWSEVKDNNGGNDWGWGWGGGWGWNPSYYIPNNMEAANYAFQDGKYVNTISCEVGADGQLTIGIKKESKLDNDWTCLDNWKVEYMGSTDDIAGGIIINEIMPANVDVYLDPSFNYGSWVELYNPTDVGFTLGGLYVTDDPQNLTKHRLIEDYGTLPAGGFAILNFEHFEIYTKPSYRQIDDKLDCDGGKIIISDGKKVLAEQEYPAAIARTSYARTEDGGETWARNGNPSPGASNQTSGKFAEIQLDAPVVDKDARVFSGSMQVTVSIPEGATLRYTTDGTAPTLTNGKVSSTGVFTVNKTTCYRFRLFKDGYLPSMIATRTYIYKDKEYPLPIISVVTDDKNLNSEEYGVFVRGKNGRKGGDPNADPANWNMDWDRPVSFEYITDKNECVVSQECDLTMCGGWSRAWTPHSFKLKAGKAYDFQNFFAAQLFDNKPYNKNKTLQIRNGGNNVQTYTSGAGNQIGGRIRDAILQQIIARSGMDIDYQEWQPVHVLVNGKYYATLSMREPNNKHHAYANYGMDSDEMDQFEICADSGYVQKEGTDEAWKHLVELSETAKNEDSYQEICQLLEMDEYINMMAAEFYLGGTDWPHNNVKGYRDRNGGKFHFVLFDLDFAGETTTPFKNFFDKEEFQSEHGLAGYDYARDESLEGTYIQYTNTFVTLFKNLLKNEKFRKKFIDTYCVMGGSVMQPDRVKAIANEMRDKIQKGINAHPEDKFDPSISSNAVINKFTKTWNSNIVDHLKNRSEMGLTNKTKQSVTISADTEGAKIFLNDIDLPYAEFDGYLFAPVKLKATPPAGYRFVEWKNATQTVSTDAEYTLPSSGAQKVTAVFEKIPAAELAEEGITPVRINEVSAANSVYINDYYKKNDWIELYNTTDKAIDIKGMNIKHSTDMSKKEKEHEFQVPTDNIYINTIIPAHGYKVVWCDKLDMLEMTGADIHTGFKLETKGGDVVIATDTYTDTLSYEQHLGTETYGRYPDGANDVYVMNVPTIAKMNKIGSYDTLYVKPIKPTPEPDAIRSYTKEGGITIAYVDGVVNIKSEDAAIRTANIYNMSGMKMTATSFTNANNQFVSINVATLPKGIYLVSATTEDGDECRIKFIIK